MAGHVNVDVMSPVGDHRERFGGLRGPCTSIKARCPVWYDDPRVSGCDLDHQMRSRPILVQSSTRPHLSLWDRDPPPAPRFPPSLHPRPLGRSCGWRRAAVALSVVWCGVVKSTHLWGVVLLIWVVPPSLSSVVYKIQFHQFSHSGCFIPLVYCSRAL